MTNYVQIIWSTPGERAAYFRGIREGLQRYAWWKDGVQYVGSCGRTLQDAYKDVDNEEGVSWTTTGRKEVEMTDFQNLVTDRINFVVFLYDNLVFILLGFVILLLIAMAIIKKFLM